MFPTTESLIANRFATASLFNFSYSNGNGGGEDSTFKEEVLLPLSNQLLGRASSVGAYVKRGEESGYVKISLKGTTKDEQLTIMRKIDMRNKSEWLFNVLTSRSRCEFAKLSPQQLLEETEKAIGDPQLPIQHSALIEKSRRVKELELAVKQLGESLNQHKALNAEQEKDVKRVRQSKNFLAKVELTKKKFSWLKYDIKKAEYMDTKEKESNAKKKLDEAAKILNDLREPIE